MGDLLLQKRILVWMVTVFQFLLLVGVLGVQPAGRTRLVRPLGHPEREKLK